MFFDALRYRYRAPVAQRATVSKSMRPHCRKKHESAACKMPMMRKEADGAAAPAGAAGQAPVRAAAERGDDRRGRAKVGQREAFVLGSRLGRAPSIPSCLRAVEARSAAAAQEKCRRARPKRRCLSSLFGRRAESSSTPADAPRHGQAGAGRPAVQRRRRLDAAPLPALYREAVMPSVGHRNYYKMNAKI